MDTVIRDLSDKVRSFIRYLVFTTPRLSHAERDLHTAR